MKRLTAMAALCVLIAACGHASKTVISYHARDYQWHKQTLWIKAHWNYQRPDKDTITADGFVEPYSPRYGIHNVDLELVGLDDNGDIVNRAAGRPKDNYIVSPLDTSPFRITMKLNGRERNFTIRGSYFYYAAGTMPDFDSRHTDDIPLKADEPY